MSNNGYISSSGINQVFTTGPYIGSIVTSSFSSGSILLGPTISFYQAFISGANEDSNSVNILTPCGNLFERYYFDPIECPIGSCLPSIAISATVANCNNLNNYNYFFFYNSGSTNAFISTIEYSTTPDFSFNTGSLIVTNSLNTYTSSLNIGNLPLLPLKSTPVYFRVFNSCSLGGTSSYSNTISASCQVTPPPPLPSFKVRLKNSMTGDNNIVYYTNNENEYTLFSGSNINLNISTLSSLNIPFRTLQPEGFVKTIIVSGSSPTFNGSISTTLNDDTPTDFDETVIQTINNYPNNLYYNSTGTPDASITVDRTLWSEGGLIEINFTSVIPPDEENPWYNPDEIGVGGGSS